MLAVQPTSHTPPSWIDTAITRMSSTIDSPNTASKAVQSAARFPATSPFLARLLDPAHALKIIGVALKYSDGDVSQKDRDVHRADRY